MVRCPHLNVGCPQPCVDESIERESVGYPEVSQRGTCLNLMALAVGLPIPHILDRVISGPASHVLGVTPQGLASSRLQTS